MRYVALYRRSGSISDIKQYCRDLKGNKEEL